MNLLHGVAGKAKSMAEMVKVGAALTSALSYNDGNDGNGPGSAPGVVQTTGTKSNVSHVMMIGWPALSWPSK
eukprot:12428850-Karenia_brevis.AAC.1